MYPLVSVIIPLYNRKALIGRCVESVLKQSFSDWELIIVDDGSTDEPQEVLDALQTRDARIRVLRQSNGGVSSARNAGLAISRGTYIQFLDSDDELLPDALKKTTIAIQNEQADVVAFCFADMRDESAAETGAELCYDTPSDFMLALMKRGLLGGPVNKLYKRSLIGDIRFRTEVSWGEDLIFNLQVLCKSRRCVFSHRGLYRVHEDAPWSLCRSYSRNGFDDLLAQAQAIDTLLNKVPTVEMRRSFYAYLWSCYMACVRKLCVGSNLSYCAKVEILHAWEEHPLVGALEPYALHNHTWVSRLMRHHVVLPVPFVQQWVVRKTRVAEMLRRLRRRVANASV